MDFYVYLHKKKTTGEVFYVGKGCGNRAWDKNARSEFWKKIAKKHGVVVEIHSENLQEWYAFELEKSLISYYGRRQLGEGTLVNLSDGGEGTKGWIASEEFRESKRNLMLREDAPNKDQRIWTFVNIDSGEQLKTTRHKFRLIHQKVLVNKICTSNGSSRRWVVMENQSEQSFGMHANNYKGKYNPIGDKTIYSITNIESGEVFEGLRCEISEKIGIKSSELVRGNRHTAAGWVLTESLLSGVAKLNQEGVNASNIDPVEYSFINVETGEEFKGRRVDFEVKYGFSLKPIFNGNKTCNKWARREVVDAYGVEFLIAPLKGDWNHNSDCTEYCFKSLWTGETFVGTRSAFQSRYEIDIGQLFSTRRMKSAGGWCLVENFDAAKEVSPFDLKVYTFVSKDGDTFSGTRKEMKDKIGVCTKPLFASKKFLKTNGWTLIENANIAFKQGRDKSDHTFMHESGEFFIGTRKEFTDKYGVTTNILFYKNAKKKHRGWSLAPKETEEFS